MLVINLNRIKLPILHIEQSDYYSLIILDSDNVWHYWDKNGDYDGWSEDVLNDKFITRVIDISMN